MTFRRNDRHTFSRAVKTAAFARADGHCQKCPAPLLVGNYQYDHVILWELSHDSSLGNCEVLCNPCHGKKNALDAAILAKSNRQRDKHIGAMDKSRTPLPGGRASRQSKTLRGRVVPRMTQGEKLQMTLKQRSFEAE